MKGRRDEIRTKENQHRIINVRLRICKSVNLELGCLGNFHYQFCSCADPMHHMRGNKNSYTACRTAWTSAVQPIKNEKFESSSRHVSSLGEVIGGVKINAWRTEGHGGGSGRCLKVVSTW
jgi:hypothetical protein